MRVQLKLIIIISFLACSLKLGAQAKNDYQWILGYPPNVPEEYFGGVRMDFNNEILSPSYFNTICPASATAVLNSNSGRLLAYSNGCNIYNVNHEIMENGDSIAYGEIWDSHCEIVGYPGTQNHLFLPWPGDTTKAALLYLKSNSSITEYYLLYSIIRIDEDYPLGIVESKDNFLVAPGTTALLTATKHANGRDWWILLPEDNTNRFFTFHFNPEGISLVEVQTIGEPWEEREWASQAIFIPNGTLYVRFNPWKGLDIFEFDRCSGTLSNAVESGPFTDPVIVGGGVAASMDSRYLYVSNFTELFQFDLSSADILSTKILIDTFDGFKDPFSTTFYQMVLAPDGKIYGFALSGVKSLHVINDPEKQGMGCDFKQHSFSLPAYVMIGAINFPYYRLGPLDDSPCDSIGLNNSPISYFRNSIDTINPLKANFKNLSYFEPDLFLWEFGDGRTSISQEAGSIEYAEAGVYNVCLTVANSYGNNKYCQLLNLNDTTTLSENIISSQILNIFPNPFKDHITIKIEEPIGSLNFKLKSVLGSTILETKLNDSDEFIYMHSYVPGLYFYSIEKDKRIIKSGTLVKYD